MPRFFLRGTKKCGLRLPYRFDVDHVHGQNVREMSLPSRRGADFAAQKG